MYMHVSFNSFIFIFAITDIHIARHLFKVRKIKKVHEKINKSPGQKTSSPKVALFIINIYKMYCFLFPKWIFLHQLTPNCGVAAL